MQDFKIVEMEDFSGEKAKIYSVILDGDEETLLEQFMEENIQYRYDLLKIVRKIREMADSTGCRRFFFKEGEGRLGDGMVALNYTGLLRLYGIYFNNTVVLLGSGGLKPPGVRSWQESPELRPKGEQMEEIAAEINRKIKEKELKILPDGTLLEL